MKKEEVQKEQWSIIDTMRLNHVRVGGASYSYGVKQVWFITLHLDETIKEEVEEHIPFLNHYINNSWLSDADNGMFSVISLQLIPEIARENYVFFAPLRFFLKTDQYLRFFFFEEDMSIVAKTNEEKRKIFDDLTKPLELILNYQCKRKKSDEEIQWAYAQSKNLLEFYAKGDEGGTFSFLQEENGKQVWQKNISFKTIALSAIAGVPIVIFEVEEKRIQEFLEKYKRKIGKNLFLLIPSKGLKILVSDRSFPLIIDRNRILFFLLRYEYLPYMSLVKQ